MCFSDTVPLREFDVPFFIVIRRGIGFIHIPATSALL
jgi:hypothetical protein